MVSLYRYIISYLGGAIVFGGALWLFWSTSSTYLVGGLVQRYPTGPLKFKEGSQEEWKEKDFNDEDWTEEVPFAPGIHWRRMEVVLDSSILAKKPLGLAIYSSLGAYNAYWDGQKLGSNGHWGPNRQEEKPGAIDRVFLLPDSWTTPGRHVLALKVAQFYEIKYRTYPYIKLSNYDNLTQSLIIIAAFMHILAGIFLVVGIYYFFVFVKSFPELPFLLFALLSSTLFGLVVLEYIKFYYAYPYTFHFDRLISISFLALLLAWLTPALYFFRFQIPWRRIILLIHFIGLLILWNGQPDFDIRTCKMVNLGSWLALVGVLWAFFKKETYSGLALLSIVPLLILPLFFYPFLFDLILYSHYTLFMIINLFALSQYVGKQRSLFQYYQERSNRLKMELLRKNIQPHFLYNTLTSLVSWVEESPNVAVQFIEALAEEFEALRQVSERKLINIQEEIHLCTTHLKVMSYRNEINYTLKTKGVKEGEMIPPAIFLTLLENGLTHNHITGKEAQFEVYFSENISSKQYRFIAPGISENDPQTMQKGTGLKYIEARLEESYGSEWEIITESTEKGWETTIYLSISNIR